MITMFINTQVPLMAIIACQPILHGMTEMIILFMMKAFNFLLMQRMTITILSQVLRLLTRVITLLQWTRKASL